MRERKLKRGGGNTAGTKKDGGATTKKKNTRPQGRVQEKVRPAGTIYRQSPFGMERSRGLFPR